MSVPPAASIKLTGRIRLTGPAGALDASDLPGRQGRLVLAALAVTDQPVPREVLAERLWGDRMPKAWPRDLSAVVSKLRALLGRIGLGGPEVIASDTWSYQLRLPPGTEVDVLRARRAAAAAAAALADGRVERAAALARGAAEIAARPFLPGEDGGWIEAVRAELAQLRLRGLETAAEAAAALGDLAEATRSLEEVIDLEPFRETAHRRLMRVLLDRGDRAAAVRGYKQVRELLASELGIDPAPETEQLYLEALRTTQPVPAATSRPGAATPEVRYARRDRMNVAYQVVGDGPVDLVLVPGWISNVELAWQEPRMAAFLRRLAASSRLILFDKRGTGLSDPIPLDSAPTLEERMDDVRAVMDAVGAERAAVLGFSEGGVMSTLFAATHPDRAAGLLLWGTWARQLRDETFPWGWTREEGMRRFVRPLQQRGVVPAHWFAPSLAGDPAFDDWFGRYARQSASPGMAIALLRANAGMDVRNVLPTVRVPTLVLHRTDDVLVPVEQGRYLARHIPGARLLEFPGRDHWPWVGDGEPVLAEIAAFLRQVAEPAGAPQHVLTTVLVALLPADADVAAHVAAHRGIVADRRADRLLARFDGPARAVECALRMVRSGGRTARAGLHTGEVTVDADRLHGLAADLARAAADRAAPGQVLVTRTVTDLVAGSGLRFADRGTQPVWAADREWRLAAAI